MVNSFFITIILFVIFFLLLFYFYNQLQRDVLLLSNWGGNDDCLPFYRFNVFKKFLVTDVCECKQNSWLYKELVITPNFKNIEVEVCSDYSGSDGLQILAYVDQKTILNLTVESNSCVNKNIDITHFADSSKHIFNLTSNSIGVCDKEFAIWKKVIIN